jgi:hypothetical protein
LRNALGWAQEGVDHGRRAIAPELARTLRKHKDGLVPAACSDAGEIDEFIIHVVPTLIGEGIPLVAPKRRTVELTLRSSKQFSDGVVRLHYAVRRGK